jgi:mRNA interferase MazF
VSPLQSGTIVWADLGETVGREQNGRRPCLVVSTPPHLGAIDTMVTIVPCTTRSRPWENHVLLDGATQLTEPTYAITEQIRTISLERIRAVRGIVTTECLAEVARWIRAWHVPAA